jgi:serine/threonine-protein kinase
VSAAPVREVLAEIAARPAAEWEDLLARRFPDRPHLVQQALLWLYATETHGRRDAQPSLGAVGDQRYELAIKLDSGATAAVWQAYDRKLGRNVAIKILHALPAPSDTAMLAQLLAEARAACDVISDHVVRILDVHGDAPHPYIVMELVGEHDPDRGQLVLGTAARSCRPGSLAEVARWVMQVARGVHDAHTRNVFHRDLKPDNVLITPISRHARIADFGLAVSAATEGAGTAATSLVTRSGAGPISVSGTPEYMAPEQARGLPLQLDPRIAEDRAVLVGIDVWGLGALAYDLLGGRPPWICEGGDREPWELAAAGVRPPPLERTAWGERIPARLGRIVEKALAADPADRYQAAGRVASELEAFLARRPTSFDRGRPVRLGLWCQRNPQLTMAALVGAALLLLTLWTGATVTRLRGQRDALDREVEAQRGELERLTRSVQQSRTLLGKTERRLEQGAADLAKLKRSIGEERMSYQELLEKKEHELREAAAAARGLADQLEAVRAAGEQQQAAYELTLAAVREDAEVAGRDRDKARVERDKSRLALDALRQQRDAATADADDARRALATLQQELSQLAGRAEPDREGKRSTGAAQ